MDLELKKYINHKIDKALKKENLYKKLDLLREYENINLISSIENALYGAFIESLHQITVVLNVFDGYSLTPEDMNDLLQIINNRKPEIKRKISQALQNH